MTLLEQFQHIYPDGFIGTTPGFRKLPKLKQEAVYTAVVLTDDHRGFFTYKGEEYFWEIAATLEDEPLLIVGPIEDL
jgi:hypothetical protein